jgi:arylsulfatase A-like enzyme
MNRAASPHKSFFFSYRSHAALRQGDWKIVREKPNAPWQLFNLAIDLAEKHNVASENAERVAELALAFDTWRESF